MSVQIHTIGVYGTSELSFFRALVDHKITHFIDVRRRRRLRGSQYAYANASALQQRLEELGIEYVHRVDLAPSLETRATQSAVDAAAGTTARVRAKLGSVFVRRYDAECLNGLDRAEFLHQFPGEARIVLFCVEHEPEACHRSLLAKHLQAAASSEWRDITPGS